ncbi:MAG: SGNH/GDSL hydrolase family protein [Firmicutes bacterium]|nr:SGNH/GDSL hydrolase family protein [Bacillota bacterium]
MELTGKKINFLGDSITEGCCATSPEKGYVEVMKRKYRLAQTRNYGISGTRIARQRIPSQEPSFDQDYGSRFDKMDPDADIIIVFGGTNDFGHGDAPMGCETDRTPDTFYGACHYLFSGLIARFPTAEIVVLTPLHRAEEKIPKPDGGWILCDYVRVIRETAAAYGLPVLDLFETSAIRGDDPETAARLTADGLHPNDLGHEILAGEIGEFLRGLPE